MHFSRFTLVAGLTALPAVSAFALPGPDPTNYFVQRADQGFNPMPTKAPAVPRWVNNKRQASSFTLEEVEPNTCGWLQDNQGVAITCGTARTCMIYNQPGGNGMAGCCAGTDYQNCGWNTGCIDSAQWESSSSFPLNSFMIYCTESAAPYCYSWIHEAYQIRDHGCGTDSYSTYETIEKSLSISGESTEVSLTLLPTGAVSVPDADEPASDNPSAPESEPARSTGPSTPDITNPPAPADDGVPIGTIVGAVVGGVGGLALIVGAVFFVCWDRKRKRKNAAAAAPATAVTYNAQEGKPFMGQQSPPSMYGAPGQPPYNPSQSPPPHGHPNSGYFAPAPGYQRDNKYNPNAPHSPQQGYAQPYHSPEGQNEIRPNTLYSEGQSPHSPVQGQQQQPPKPAVHELG